MPHDPEEPEEVEYLQILDPEWDIDVFAKTRDELLSWVHSDIRMIWKHFVSQDDSRLDSRSLAVKRKYIDVAEVVDG